jgi:7 transmembrane sweet-taste receptor of 3 GCPR
VALTTQFLMFNSQELLAMPASVEGQLATCHDHRWSLVALMSYDALLLVLLLLVSPLVARSKRNYREGIFFCVAAWLSAICWGLWVSGFMLLGTEWRAACIAFGHCACASVVLGSVFVPRTYLIVSSVTRARIASAIPAAAAAYSSSTNILDIQYRSNQVTRPKF